jgi:hypothetical protein
MEYEQQYYGAKSKVKHHLINFTNTIDHALLKVKHVKIKNIIHQRADNS